MFISMLVHHTAKKKETLLLNDLLAAQVQRVEGDRFACGHL